MDTWAVGEAYEGYIGRWSRPVAAAVLDWLAVPGHKEWLDVGCGTGAVCQAILAHEPARVVGVDASAGFVDHARQRIADPRVRFQVGDGQRLELGSDSVDVAVSGLVLNFFPRPAVAVAEMVRVVREGGTVAAYVWDYAGGMELLRRFWDAAVALDPAAAALDEAKRFPLCRPEALAALFAGADLDEVATIAIEVPTHFADFDDLWRPFLAGQGPAPSYVAGLDDERRTALRERLRAALPSLDLSARAFAVRGRLTSSSP